MIELESFRKFRRIDYLAIFSFAFVWALLTYLINIPDTLFTFYLSLFITAFFMSFAALLVRRFFAATLFYLTGAIITIPVNNLGGLGFYKVPILFAAGIIFELFFILLKMEIKSIPLNLVLGTAFSTASIPLTMLLFVPVPGLGAYAANFAVSALIIGALGATAAFLAWYNVKGLKQVIKFEYSA